MAVVVAERRYSHQVIIIVVTAVVVVFNLTYCSRHILFCRNLHSR